VRPLLRRLALGLLVERNVPAALDLAADEQAAVAYEHRWEFRSFGGVSYALGCVPILSWLLEFSSSVGAALWAADMEKSERIRLL